ncbi:MAG: phasin family protein [Woeseiaceae bacterium]|nr:phasin family protein [Woeseiaceae bacterium]
MKKKKPDLKQKDIGERTAEIAGQLEHIFLAGLGALANTQKVGSKAFEALVKQGESYRKGATDKTETLIDDVQDAIRGMTHDAQSKATGLLDQMRDTPQMEKLQNVFDSRVDSALNRLGVASKHDVDKLNAKLDRLLKSAEKQKSSTKKATKKTSPAKKTAKKSSAKKGSAKKSSAKKSSTRKASKKKVSKKSV